MKPFFKEKPKDVTVLVDGNVEFQCKVGGDPLPNILWRRDDGKMPIGRAQIQDDKSLRIEHVVPGDEGLYICEAENVVGTISARASLLVHCKFMNCALFSSFSLVRTKNEVKAIGHNFFKLI